MNKITTIIATFCTMTVAACSQAPDGSYSLRQTIADTLNTYPANDTGVDASPQIVPVVTIVPGASQVAIIGGEVMVPTGGIGGHPDWRPHETVDVVNVGECQSAMLQLGRTDKPGVPTAVFVTRSQGMIFIASTPGQGCMPPYGGNGFPGGGRFHLTVHGRVQRATVQIRPLE